MKEKYKILCILGAENKGSFFSELSVFSENVMFNWDVKQPTRKSQWEQEHMSVREDMCLRWGRRGEILTIDQEGTGNKTSRQSK